MLRGILCATLAAAALVGCSQEEGGVRRVILITCDTLRADHLGVYGYERDTSPALDAFARECVVFDQAYTTSPHTHPSMSSLMTSRMPDEVGLAGGNRRFISSEVTTLAEVLQAAGIPTAAVVSNWVLRSIPGREGGGLQQGFDHYDDEMSAQELNREAFERIAPDTTAAAIDWLSGGRGDSERFFLWVHYQDPHGPYTPPEALASAFARDADSARELRLGSTHKGRGQLPSYQAIDGELRPDFYLDRYDAEICFFDQSLGELLDWLRANDLYEDALIVFSADHGESLGEQDYWFCHGETLQRELVRAPFLVRYPAGAVRPATTSDGLYDRSSALVGHLDLWPTALAAFRLPELPSRGTSLLAVELPEDRVLAQTLGKRRTPHRIEAVTDGRHRLVTDRAGTRLYDALLDPGEQNDLSSARPDEVARLRTRLRHFFKSSPGPVFEDSGEVPLDEQGLRALDALGYLDSGGEEE